MATARLTPSYLHGDRSRLLPAAVAVVALVLVVVLSPDAARVEASPVFGALRSPGEPAFAAGHRGGKDGAPENTIPAFELAIASDVVFLETDLQLTSDGVPVLMHDWTLDRTTNGTGPVWASTWDEVARLDAGSWYSPELAGTRVPRLEQLLDVLRPSGKSLILELKGAWTGAQLAPVAEQIRARGLGSRVVVASFDIVSLAALGGVAPELQRAVITHELAGDPAVLAGTCGAVAIATSREFLERDPGAVGRIHNAGLGVLAYTLNGEKSWAQATALGIDGIITDKPLELDAWLAGEAAAEKKAASALDTGGR